MICRHRLGMLQPYFLNPAHPSHRGFLALGAAAKRIWEVPRNDLPAVPESVLAKCTAPVDPPCRLLETEVSTRSLLFIRAAGSVTHTQLADMLSMYGKRDALVVMNRLERLGLISREISLTRRGQTG